MRSACPAMDLQNPWVGGLYMYPDQTGLVRAYRHDILIATDLERWLGDIQREPICISSSALSSVHPLFYLPDHRMRQVS